MREINIEEWTRRSHYKWFSTFSNPCYSMDVRIDLTNLLDYCKLKDTSSFATIVYIVGKALNSIQAFRYRIDGEKVLELDYANVAYTVSVNDEYFVNSRISMLLEYNEFCKSVRSQIDEINRLKKIQQVFNNTKIINDIYCSCIPWIDFVAMTQPIPDNDPNNLSIPRVCWGKYSENNKKIETTFNITANHALVDGKDMAQAFLTIQKYANFPECYLE